MRIKPAGVCVALSLIAFVPGEMRSEDPSPAKPVRHVVEMVLQDGEYRFVPSEVRAKRGDSITFLLRSGGPHNIAFNPAKIPDAVEPRLSANLPRPMSPLAGPLLTEPGATYVISLEGIPPGVYPYFCMPHVAAGMTGTIRVTE